MTFDCKKQEDVKRLQVRIEYLIKNKKKIEVTEKRGIRTLSQNNYLHLILSWFCIETGNKLEYVKQEYFKKLCNADIFVYHKQDPYIGKVQIIRSTSQVNTKEMTDAIERFRNWSSQQTGIYLPSPNEDKFLEHIQEEILKQRQWL